MTDVPATLSRRTRRQVRRLLGGLLAGRGASPIDTARAFGEPFPPAAVEPYRRPGWEHIAASMDVVNDYWRHALEAEDIVVLVEAERAGKIVAAALANALADAIQGGTP